MKIVEILKLRLRANKYKNRDDKGGIAYLFSNLKKGDSCFDIGAHKAGYLYFMVRLVGSKGKVFAFEPQSNLYKYIKKIVGLLNWDNVQIEHVALSNTSSTTTLYIPTNNVSKGSSPGATIIEHKERNDFGATEKVSTDSLDNYCMKHNIAPAFLKIDVEGNELNIFKGGVSVLKKYKPKILVEIESRHIGEQRASETFAFLQSLGYEGRFIHRTEFIPLASFNFAKYQNLDDMANYCNNFIFESK
jgi:FkbM family methyltransferase